MLFLLLLVATCQLFAQQDLAAGRKLFKEEKYSAALAKAENLLKDNPDFDSALVLKGECLWRMKKYQEGFTLLTKVVNEHPRYNYAWYVRAHMQRMSGNLSEAKNDLSMALRNIGQDTLAKDIYNDRAWVNLKIRNLDAGREDALMTITLDSTNTTAMSTMALCLNQSNQPDSALTWLRKAFAIDSTNLGTTINMGFVLLKKEKFEEAIEWLNRAIRLDPKEAYTYNNRGYAKYKLGDLNAAMTDINKSLSMDDHNSYAFRNRALVYIALAKYDKACMDLQKATELGYRENYGDEVDQLRKEYCKK